MKSQDGSEIYKGRAGRFVQVVNEQLPSEEGVFGVGDDIQSVTQRLMEGYFIGIETDEKLGISDAQTFRSLGVCAGNLLRVRVSSDGKVMREANLPVDAPRGPKGVFEAVAGQLALYVCDPDVDFSWPERQERSVQVRRNEARSAENEAVRALARRKHLRGRGLDEKGRVDECRHTRQHDNGRESGGVDYRPIASRLAASQLEEGGYCLLLGVMSGLQTQEGALPAARSALWEQIDAASCIESAVPKEQQLTKEERLLLAFLSGREVKTRDGIPKYEESDKPLTLEALKAHYARVRLHADAQMNRGKMVRAPKPEEVDKLVVSGLSKLIALRGNLPR